MATNTVTTNWKKNMQFESDNPSGHSLTMYDASADNGDAKGFGPKALMLSSLAGCSGLDIDSLLKKMRAEVDDFNIVVTGELTEEHPKFYHKVKVDYHFYGTGLKEDKITKAVNLSVDTYCGVMEMFRQFATITTEIHLHEK
ncbi:MAG: OsmC family protein [Flavobacteriaceae bacterium]|nr:OsmC family protein [Flavobacteriaceae bacterium]